MEIVIFAILTPILVFGSFKAGESYRKKVGEGKIKNAETEAGKMLEKAKTEVENVKIDCERMKKEAILFAKDETLKQKMEIEKMTKERKRELADSENRINQRQDMLDKRIISIEDKEKGINSKLTEIENTKLELSKAKDKQIEVLSSLSKLSVNDAKNELLNILKGDMTHEMAAYVKTEIDKAKYEVDKKSKDLLLQTISRCAADHTAEATVTVVNLPSDDLKGRIIGREGRNIRTIETLTGIDLIIDDTPDVIVLSSFDPIRREIARIAIERLIADGRVHPGKIEDMIEKAKAEVENTIKEEGERALFETGVVNLPNDLVNLLGKLRFRTSYGQNVLNHSIEVSNICGLIASELGLDVTLAKRAGLLHDIGKAVDHDAEGTHVTLGVELLTKFNENKEVISAVASHHGDIEPTSLEAVIVQIADTVSASRPGARRETVSTYIKRMQKLEEICTSYKGVEKSFAIQAGREVRLIIKPEEVSDDKMVLLARDVANQIEKEMTYPGQIKVSLIRESRATEIAK